MAVEGSKAKYLRDLLDKALVLGVPTMSPEEFERVFGLKVEADEIRGITFAEVMVRQLVLKACAGNDKSIDSILDRLLGKPVQTIDATTRSYTYQDFLAQCREQDALEAKRNAGAITVTPDAPKLPVPARGAPAGASVDDILADLI